MLLLMERSKYTSCLFLLGMLFQAAQGQDLQGKINRLSILNCVRVPITVGNLKKEVTLVTAKIDLQKTDTLFLKSYGYLLGKDTVKFITDVDKVTIKSTPGSNDSLFWEMSDCKGAMAPTSLLDFPDIKDRPKEFVEVEFQNLAEFDQRLNQILNKYSPMGTYPVYENKIRTQITPYKTLQVDDPKLIGEVSLFVTLPVERESKYYVQLSYIAKEHRRMSTTRKDAGSVVREKSRAYFEQFVQTLRK